ncbi:acyltransferase family protein [Sideroxydans lithotrophicus]|uniref:Acyltransferase 3 n=1 Tax=Sideroxydans lithotrophicus (strain ES-1) TaxID=580332 RepID=D5CQ87_SIDLE|nr:acyltransferase [Sideroxydans lithotrophicus]ADE13108.1 acyltransferase 3 [Sideroxydans lithotrophicus ES-1]
MQESPQNKVSVDRRLRVNNFDLLRFVFAFIVFLVHAYVLSGADSLSILSEIFSSEIAVKSFFVVSGFLIFMSYENSKDVGNYFSKRARRIYPAYIFVVVACAVLGMIFSKYSWHEYISLELAKYILANLVFLNFMHPSLPGVFEHNSLQAINGALWTLKIEVMFYLLVPVVVRAFRKYGRMKVIFLLYACSVIYSIYMEYMANKTGAGFYLELQRQLPGQLVYFIAGATSYYYFQHFAKYAPWLALLAVTAFALKSWLPWIAVQPIALGVLVIYFACIFSYVGNFGKYGDFSYGVYIVHFPILQLLISFGLFNTHPWLMLLSAGFMVVTTAYFLWHFVEKRFLRKSSHYVAVNQE